MNVFWFLLGLSLGWGSILLFIILENIRYFYIHRDIDKSVLKSLINCGFDVDESVRLQDVLDEFMYRSSSFDGIESYRSLDGDLWIKLEKN